MLSNLSSATLSPCCEPDGGAHTDDTDDGSDDDLPSPVHPQQMYHLSAVGVHDAPVEHTNEAPPPSTLGLMQDIGSTDGRGFEETNSPAPLDPNLKCPKCAKYFKKGRIQKYRHHVEKCKC